MKAAFEQDKLIREKSFLRAIPLFALAGLFWTFVYYFYGAKKAAIIPGAYCITSLTSLFIYYRGWKNFSFFRFTQLLLILLLPALLHISLGNFISSSAVVLWSALCPLGALVFHNSRAALHWLFAYIFMIVVAFSLENKLFPPETELPPLLINIFFLLNITSVIILVFFILRYFVNQNELAKEQLKKEHALLAAEREKSEKLLLNILPPFIAKRLKEGEQVIADKHEEAVVLFVDIVDFTATSQQVSPEMLVENLNKIFTHFDTLAEKYRLEKIKTIGDSYMVATGLTEFQNEQIRNMADFALEIIMHIQQFTLDGNTRCNARIGIHIGTVVAGVIGSKKFSYDVWGDAVNTASRMETSAEAGRIQVSEAFYEYIKNDYLCEFRGQSEIKGKGMMKLYYLVGKK